MIMEPGLYTAAADYRTRSSGIGSSPQKQLKPGQGFRRSISPYSWR